MVGSSALMAITLALLAATIKYKKELLEDYDPKIVNLLPLVEMILYILFFGLGVGTVPWLLLGELCPVKVKGMYTQCENCRNLLQIFFSKMQSSI